MDTKIKKMLNAGESETVEFKRILNGFKEYGLPTPEFREMSSGFMVTVYKKTEQVTEQVGTKSAPG